MKEHFGEYAGDSLHAYWMAFNEACKRKHDYMIMNLLVNLPTLNNAKGKLTFFGEKPKGYFLEEGALKNLMEFIIEYPIAAHAKATLLDSFARINDKRTFEFLIKSLFHDDFSLYEKRSAIRALVRLFSYRDLISGKTSGVMIPVYDKDDPESVKEFLTGREFQLKRWEERKKDYPTQILPRNFCENQEKENSKKSKPDNSPKEAGLNKIIVEILTDKDLEVDNVKQSIKAIVNEPSLLKITEGASVIIIAGETILMSTVVKVLNSIIKCKPKEVNFGSSEDK